MSKRRSISKRKQRTKPVRLELWVSHFGGDFVGVGGLDLEPDMNPNHVAGAMLKVLKDDHYVLVKETLDADDSDARFVIQSFVPTLMGQDNNCASFIPVYINKTTRELMSPDAAAEIDMTIQIRAGV